MIASQLPPSTTTVMACTARGVAWKKIFELQRMELRELKDVQEKIEINTSDKPEKNLKLNSRRKKDIL